MRIRSLLLALAACGGGDDAPTETPDAAIVGEDWGRDILDTSLAIDLASREATATIRVAAADSDVASFEAGDLEILSVSSDFRTEEGALHVATTPGEEATIEVDYRFTYHGGFMGADDSPPLTLTWPYWCGNVFPCKNIDSPADGTRFALELTGVPADQVAVYPAEIATDAPPYMLAWAIGDFDELALGATTAGTSVSIWHPPAGAADAAAGGAHLVAAFDWLETRIGPYRYGDAVGSVSVSWGPGAYGGMEHHPYWHVASIALDDEEIHVHEAAHGWFGNGVRVRCWEDFVLSEGTVTYLAAHVLEELDAEVGAAVWDEYADRLADLPDGVAWPASCGEVEILELFSDIPYIRGAYFYRAVAAEVGAAALDAALAAFYAAHAGEAAGVQEMLDTIEAETGFDPTACAQKWLRDPAVPADLGC
jgi:aminopeptidase N